MTREEAILVLEYRRCLICQTCRYFHTPFVCEVCRERNCNGEKEALKMAIEALEAEPVKHGRWIYVGENNIFECSLCSVQVRIYEGFKEHWHYCPYCGASMDESEAEE